MIIKNGTVFCGDGIFRIMDVETRNGIITAIDSNINDNSQEMINAENDYIVPGFVDIHTHGAMGADFCDGTPEAVEIIARYLLSCGITSFLGTTMTLPKEQLIDICKTARPIVDAEYTDRAIMRGIHIEGSFISYEKRGAQNADYIAGPDLSMLEELIEAGGDTIRLAVIAPEIEGGLEFVEKASRLCTISIAHSAALYDTACKAFSLGANHVTHLFNGMNAFLQREPAVVGAAFDCDAYVELISDGVHIHPSVVRAVFKMFGEDRVCLVSDSMRACGLKDGQYELGGQLVTVKDSTPTLEDGALAGSVTSLAGCMRKAVDFGIPLPVALKAATLNPAKSVGLDTEIGSLTLGKRADILIMDRALNLKQVFLNGMRV